jgi:hypothetical protein
MKRYQSYVVMGLFMSAISLTSYAETNKPLTISGCQARNNLPNKEAIDKIEDFIDENKPESYKLFPSERPYIYSVNGRVIQGKANLIKVVAQDILSKYCTAQKKTHTIEYRQSITYKKSFQTFSGYVELAEATIHIKKLESNELELEMTMRRHLP